MSVDGGARVAKPARAERRAERNNSAEAVGAQKRRLPCYRGADVVARDHCLFGTERIDETHDVADVVEDRILLHLVGTIALPIAAQVGGHSTEPGLRQRLELMSSARLHCTINTPSLILNEGAQFDGDCRMPRDRMAA